MRNTSPGLFDVSPTPLPQSEQDQALGQVETWIHAHCRRKRKTVSEFFGDAIRQAIDEVIDGPRTGRWSVVDLEKTEKTYIGTKMEIVIRSALGLEPRKPLDFVIEGHPIDVKWSLTSKWAIPTEAVDHMVLVVGTNERGTTFQVGLIRCFDNRLNPGMNKDKKRTLSKKGRDCIRWLVFDEQLKPNFLATLDPEVQNKIRRGKSAQERLRLFAQLVIHRPFPRNVIETLAYNKDPTRRTRRDAVDRLGGMRIMSGKYRRQRELIESLGYSCAPHEFISIHEFEAKAAESGMKKEV